jgi:hypothetical protein
MVWPVVVFGVAGFVAVAVLAVIVRAGRTPHVCHYCGRTMPRRRLRTIELTGAGDVEVCVDARGCRDTHVRDRRR